MSETDQDLICECECGNYFTEIDLENHFKTCSQFKEKYENLDTNISSLLSGYIANDNYLLLSSLFEEYISVLNKAQEKNKNKKYFPKITKTFVE